MVRLMGVRVFAVGFRPGVVSSLIGLGVDLDGVEAARDLEDALERLLAVEEIEDLEDEEQERPADQELEDLEDKAQKSLSDGDAS